MIPAKLTTTCGPTLDFTASGAVAGVVAPDCSAEKGARTGATKSAVGIEEA